MQKSYIALELPDKKFLHFFYFLIRFKIRLLFLNRLPVSWQAIWRPSILSKAKQ